MKLSKLPLSAGRPGGRGFRAAPPSASQGSAEVEPENVRHTLLENGLNVLTERVPGVRSAAAGIWFRQGVAHEDPGVLGVSHMLEHMVFKGTESRSARDIALSLESLGGSLDAYTSREHTSYQARVLDRHLPVALEVLADLTVRPLLRAEDLELEREVVLEEIATVEDTPDDLVFELHAGHLWQEHPYGSPILGTRETVSQLSSDHLRQVHAESYRAGNAVVVVAGNLDHDEAVAEVARRFEAFPEGEPAGPVPAPAGASRGRRAVIRESAQSHIVFGAPSVSRGDPRRHALVLLSQALGGGMSSRLFQRIREELGLAYAVFSFQSFYRAAGTLGVYVGTRPDTEDAAVQAVADELEALARHGLPDDEVGLVREQVKGQLTLGMESLSNRMHRLAGFALHDEPVVDLSELLARYDRVTSAELAECAGAFLDPEAFLVLTLGPDRA